MTTRASSQTPGSVCVCRIRSLHIISWLGHQSPRQLRWDLWRLPLFLPFDEIVFWSHRVYLAHDHNATQLFSRAPHTQGASGADSQSSQKGISCSALHGFSTLHALSGLKMMLLMDLDSGLIFGSVKMVNCFYYLSDHCHDRLHLHGRARSQVSLSASPSPHSSCWTF